jgi:hypothetical protein
MLLYHRNAGASVQRAVVVRQVQMRSHPRPVVRNVQAVIGTWSFSTAAPQIRKLRMTREFAKTSISTTESYRKSDHQLRLEKFYSRKSVGFASITFL